jgi:hypothetical protein
MFWLADFNQTEMAIERWDAALRDNSSGGLDN